ncbi:MAG: polyphosphate kinase 2 [Parvularculaceae bacterium]|nr:polyphosphate kinase 2 [Parvularculaceae bacterium]
MKEERYEKEFAVLEFELAKLQETVMRKGMKVAVVFEGRDAAGKGGIIKTIMTRMNPRVWRVAALPKPSDRERTQWYFQRYVAHLPAAGEVVLFDRSWYNRAVVEPVMGWCTVEEHESFMRDAPAFEKLIVGADILLIKFWVHVGGEEQERRFQDRACDPRKRWKLSEIDLEGRKHWAEMTRRRDRMLKETSSEHAPWRVIDGDDKEKARLNAIRAILDLVPYDYNEAAFEPIKLPPRQSAQDAGYQKSDLEKTLLVKDYYADA